MSVRTIIDCDNCHVEGVAQTLQAIDLGTGPARLDLCPSCREALGLDALHALLDEFGAKVEAATKARADDRQLPPSAQRKTCPVCGVVLSGRGAAIGHCRNVHGMTEAEATRAVPPPNGRGIECPTCGFLADGPNGASRHAARHEAEAAAT